MCAAQGQRDDSGKLNTPSAGGQYPLTAFVRVRDVESLDAGFFVYDNARHALHALSVDSSNKGLRDWAIGDQSWLGEAAAIILLAADVVSMNEHFADQPPQGQRGERYAYIETGCAAQNIQLQACAEGLACVLIAGYRDEATADVLNLQEPYEPIAHLCIVWPAVD